MSQIELKSFHVAGVGYRPANIIDRLVTGDVPRLVAEPENKFDPFAIKIEAYQKDENLPEGSWNHIGYIPKKDTWIFHVLRKAGVKIYCRLFVNHDARDEDKVMVLTSFYGDANAAFKD